MASIASKYGITAFNLILIITVTYIGVDTFYDMLTARMPDHPTVIQSPQAPPETKTSSSTVYAEYEDITKRHIFKTDTPKAPSMDAVQTRYMEATQLDLKLWGTVTGLTQRPYAIIEDGQSRKQKLYRQGDRIQNAVLKAVFWDKVVLTVDGRDEVLRLQNIRSGSRRSTPTAKLERRRPKHLRNITLRRQQVTDAMENVNQLVGQIKVQPHTEDGIPNGFVLSEIASGSLFRRMGLRNGDIVLGVNGEAINSMEDAMRLYRTLGTADKVALQINRNGRSQTIHYDIR